MYWFLYYDGLYGLLGTYQCHGVCIGAASGVVRIQPSGAIWVGKFIPDAFHICNEHFEVISTVLFAYRAAIQDGGFAKG